MYILSERSYILMVNVGDEAFDSLFAKHIQEQRMKSIDNIKKIGEQNWQRILNCIEAGMPYGKTTSELVKETGLDRDTIYSHCKQLIKKGLIIKQGKFGKYRLTTKFYNNPIYMAQCLMREILQEPSFRTGYVSLHNKFTNEKLSEKFEDLYSQGTNFFKIIRNRSKMDAILIYEFANRIGAIITYLIIQAFQFSRDSQSSLLNAMSHMEKNNSNANQQKYRQKGFVDGNLMDKLTIEWINKAIQPYMILNEFVRFMNYERSHIYGEDILRRTKKPDNNNPKSWSFYEIERSDYQKFLNAFGSVYPDVFDLIEHIKNEELPGKINKSIEWHNQQVAHLLCMPHLFKTHIIKKEKYFTCSRCEIEFKVKISNIVTNQELIAKLNTHSKKKMRKTCEEQKHIWVRSTYTDLSQNIFECCRCYRWLMLPAESKEKLDEINKSIPTRFGTENDVILCKQVQKFFYDGSNEQYSINELLSAIKSNKSYDGLDANILRRGRGHISTIITRAKAILDFLVEVGFLSLGIARSPGNDPLSQTYIHKNQTNWK